MKFGWRIIVGTILAFLGSSFGTVGGVGGDGIVPMLTLIIGFDAKSATAILKCKNMYRVYMSLVNKCFFYYFLKILN